MGAGTFDSGQIQNGFEFGTVRPIGAQFSDAVKKGAGLNVPVGHIQRPRKRPRGLIRTCATVAHFVLGAWASSLILSGDPATASPCASLPPGRTALRPHSHRRAAGQDPLSGDLLMPIYY